MKNPDKGLQGQMKNFMRTIEVLGCYNKLGKFLLSKGNPEPRVRGLIEWAVANNLEKFCTDY